MAIYASHEGTRFYRIPNEVTLPVGTLEIEGLSGLTQRVDGDSATKYEIPEAEAQAATEKIVAKVTELRDQLQQLASAATVAAEAVGHAPPSEVAARTARVLQLLGVTEADVVRAPVDTLQKILATLPTLDEEKLFNL